MTVQKLFTPLPPPSIQTNIVMKIPKLNVQNYGDNTEFINFWNAFKVSVNDND